VSVPMWHCRCTPRCPVNSPGVAACEPVGFQKSAASVTWVNEETVRS
jgi:hypothetical protein